MATRFRLLRQGVRRVLKYATAGMLFFACIGLIFWIADGKPMGLFALGCLGAILGALMGIGQILIDRFGGRSTTAPAQQEAPHADASATTGNARPIKRREWIMASVWPKAHANAEELKALGRELEEWRARHPAVTRIGGLGELLAGRYPMPSGPTLFIGDRNGDAELPPVPGRDEEELAKKSRLLFVKDPWLFCPAEVWAGEGITSDETIADLRRSISRALVSGIGIEFY